MALADQSRAASTALAVGEPPANPFLAKKEIRRGEISEKGKGGGWWGASSSAGQAARLRDLAFCAKMGSSEFKKSLQVGRN